MTRRDAGLADSGFPDMEKYGIAVYTPISDHSHPMYKAHSHLRIKVENVIAEFKVFECLHAEVREKILSNEQEMLDTHTKRWEVVGGIINVRKNGWDDL